MDPDTVLLSLDFLIELGGNAIVIGDQAFQDRNAPQSYVRLLDLVGRRGIVQASLTVAAIEDVPVGEG